MAVQIGRITGDFLVKWREPNAYVRSSITVGRGIGLAVLGFVPFLLLTMPLFNNQNTGRRIFLGLIYLIICLCCFLKIWFGLGDAIYLDRNGILSSSGRSIRRTYYRDIEGCNVISTHYKGNKFFILKFHLVKGLPAGQIREIGVPESVDLQSVLDVLKKNSIRIDLV
jgi:hypothetical protein